MKCTKMLPPWTFTKRKPITKAGLTSRKVAEPSAAFRTRRMESLLEERRHEHIIKKKDVKRGRKGVNWQKKSSNLKKKNKKELNL